MFGAELPACLTMKDCKSMLGLMGVKEEETSPPLEVIVCQIQFPVLTPICEDITSHCDWNTTESFFTILCKQHYSTLVAYCKRRWMYLRHVHCTRPAGFR
ncbi:hypothetical protein J6590_091305 [Homalodisca vitripennis]|nr:hypothetical protein J6590_091305 [Homalodisca vitripennis]